MEAFGETLFTARIKETKPSIIREILKVTVDKEVISFAGGLPNPISFPKSEFEVSLERICDKTETYQYAQSEGYEPLREYIANRYDKRFQMKVDKEDILITTGSQQALDLLGKVLLDQGDKVIIEEPGYLGAIQAFSMFQPKYVPIKIDENGMEVEKLENELSDNKVKLIYTVPNFQNPVGITYSQERRQAIREIISEKEVFLIEDDPYGELSFDGDSLPYIGKDYQGSVLLGSFSKTLSPGIRVGYICTKNKQLMQHLITAKQATDLHTSIFSQRLIYDYLTHNDYDKHISKIRQMYKNQSEYMYQMIKEHFPKEVSCIKPKGGMFMWCELNGSNVSANELLEYAKEKKVIFVPGDAFYTNTENLHNMRLNFTNSNEKTIKRGIKMLGDLLVERWN